MDKFGFSNPGTDRYGFNLPVQPMDTPQVSPLQNMGGLNSMAPQPIQAPAPQFNGGLSDHQINSYHTVLNLSTPQQRQQMLAQLSDAAKTSPQAQQLLQSVQGYNIHQPDQGQYHNSVSTALTNLAETNPLAPITAIPQAAYNIVAKPLVTGATAAAKESGTPQFMAQSLPNQVGQFAGKFAQAGYESSPLASGVNLFSAGANQATQALGINRGNTTNSLVGGNESFSNQAHQGGVLPTLANAAGNVVNAAGAGDAHIAGDAPGLKSAVSSDIKNMSNSFGTHLSKAIDTYHNSVLGGEAGNTGLNNDIVQPRHPQGEETGKGGQFAPKEAPFNPEPRSPQELINAEDTHPREEALPTNAAEAHASIIKAETEAAHLKQAMQTEKDLLFNDVTLRGDNRRIALDDINMKYKKAVDLADEHVKFAHEYARDNIFNKMQGKALTTTPETALKPVVKTKESLINKAINLIREPLKSEQGSANLFDPIGKDDSSPEAIAKGLGMSKEELAKAQAEHNAPEQPLERSAMAKPESGIVREGTPMTAEERASQQARMDALNNPTKNNVDLSNKGGIKGAIANSQMVEGEMARKANRALNAANALSKDDRKLADQYERGQSINDVASQAKNPEKLAAALTKLEDYYDYKLAAERAVGAQVPKVENYGRHFWDLSNKADEERFNQFATQQGLGKFNGTSSQPRVFRTYAEGEAQGFKRSNPDIFKDLEQDAQMSRSRIAGAVLKDGIVKAGGDQVSTTGQGVDANGKQFINSNINGLNGLSYSHDIAKQLRGYNELDRNVFGKSYDKLNSFQKNVVLSLSFFHSMNISLNFAGTEGFAHPFVTMKGLGNSALSFISPKYYEHLEDGFKKRGVLDWEGKNGVAVGTNLDTKATAMQKIGGSKWNLGAQMHKALFEREIPVMTHTMSELAMKKGIEAGTPEGIAYGQEVNNIMGLLNQKLLARDPNTQKWLNRAMLAPAFTETKYRTLFDAATKFTGDNKSSGNLARQAVVGKTALTALIGIVGGIVATGKFPTVQNIMGQLTAPYVPTNIKNKSGGTKGAFLPQTFVSEPLGPLVSLAHGDTSGLLHYGAARLSPNIATAQKLLTNQDYFGNQIFDPNKPVAGQIAGQALKQTSPIGVQNLLNATGPNKKGIAETALDEAGFRVKNDPNDPTNKQTASYFNNLASVKKGLTANQIADFNSINPQTKNPDGSYTPESAFDPQKAPQKVLTLLKDPAVLDATIKLNQSQKNHDPMWDLPKDQLQTFLTYQGIQGTDYESATAKEIKSNNPWITDLNTQRSNWFQTLPKSQNPNSSNPLQYPTADPQTQSLLDSYNQITDSTKKSQFLQANPQVTQFFNALDQYTNARRTQEGVPQFAQAPQASSYVQQQMNNKNWNDPQVQQFLNASTAFKSAGPFGDGISGAGGNRNTSPQALAFLQQGLTASGKTPYTASKSNASTNNKIKNAIKNTNRNVKYEMKKSQKSVHQVSYHQKSVGPKTAVNRKVNLGSGYLAQALARANTGRKA